jgi:hypothetical protein
VLHTIEGSEVDAHFGTVVRSAWDANADQVPELLITKSFACQRHGAAASVDLVSPLDGATIATFADNGANAAYFGRSACIVGQAIPGKDVRVVIGNPADSAFGVLAGQSTVFAADGGRVHCKLGVGKPYAQLGVWLESINDRFADGYANLLAVGDQESGAESWIFDVNCRDVAPFKLPIRMARCLGDINNDGADDIVGFVEGGQWSTLSIVSGATYNPILTFASQFDPFSRRHLEAVGDLDSDGVNEVAVVVNRQADRYTSVSEGKVAQGVIRIYSGADGRLLWAIEESELLRLSRANVAVVQL